MSTLYIMRGLPGSGKSTKARELAGSKAVFSTDDFFMVDGEYKWDRERLSEAHEWNRIRVRDAMRAKVPIVVIDNTHVRVWEFEAAIGMAREYDYTWKIVTADAPWADDPIECAKRTTHGVPFEMIEKMHRSFEPFDTKREGHIATALGYLHRILDKWVEDATNHMGLSEEEAEKFANEAADRFRKGQF